MRPGLEIGAPHVVRYTVPADQTVPDLLPALAEFRRGEPVFATGFMVGLMEAPCMAAVYPYLERGEVTLGTLITMSHMAPSPLGTSLVAEARVVTIEGRSVRFSVIVRDDTGEIAAAGEHGLRIIHAARFHDRLAAKRAHMPRRQASQVPTDRHSLAGQQRHVRVTLGVRDGARSHGSAGQGDEHRIAFRQRQPTRASTYKLDRQ